MRYWRLRMHRHNRSGELRCQRLVDTARLRETVERLVFVEAEHVDCPFDRLTISVERKVPACIAGDRHHTTVDLRGESLVDLQFR